MTWGSHCDNCGNESCDWYMDSICEGQLFPDRVAKRNVYDRLPWYKKIFRKRNK